MRTTEIDRVRQLYTEYERIQAVHPGTQRDVFPNLIRETPLYDGGSGAVIYSHLDAEGADDVIEAQIAFFEQIGCDFEWKHYDYDTPPDLKERLNVHGFQFEETEAIMVLPLDRAPTELLAPVVHDVRRISDPAQLEDIRRIKEEVWGEEREFVTDFLRKTLEQASTQMRIYIAYADDLPVSCGWIHLPDDNPFASLWGGSTLASHRKQGFYTALLAMRVQDAIACGKQYLTIDASPMSRPIVERFGFVLLAESTPCIWRTDRAHLRSDDTGSTESQG
jgi:hypothetical protein